MGDDYTPRVDFQTVVGKPIKPNIKSWELANQIAVKVLTGKLKDSTDGATHYYNPSLASPDWATSMIVTRSIGNHVFLKIGNK
jgi:spore germination cell wall hydrolase CwlJ-like protein